MAGRVQKYFTHKAAQGVRRFIREAGGNEVFVVGELDDNLRVGRVRLFARGNELAVPALMQVARPGSVVIHNHPSGVLSPSNADIGVASRLGNDGIAFFIVNNAVDDVYAVIEPFQPQKRAALDPQAMQSFLGAEGPISRALPGYELRPQQLTMIEMVSRAFNENKIAVIEAGTGTGKTLAYLLPALVNAIENEERCVISTNTINLQEQVIKKDIPFLEKVFDKPFKAVLVKGRTNYLCRRKLDEVSSDLAAFSDPEQMAELKTIVEWAKTSKDGSKSDLSFVPHREVWEKIQSESDTTLKTKCPYYNECFFYKARRQAATANLLVVNHHLLFADLAVRAAIGDESEVAVLPKYHRVILDEAHNVEEVATNYFGAAVSYLGLKRILAKLQRTKSGATKGLLPFLIHKLERIPDKITVDEQEQITRMVNEASQSVADLEYRIDEWASIVFEWLQSVLQGSGGSASWADDAASARLRITSAVRSREDWQQHVVLPVNELLHDGVGLVRRLDKLLERLEQIETRLEKDVVSLTVDLRAQRDRFNDALATLTSVVLDDDDEHVRWVEGRQGRWGLVLHFHLAPLEVRELMKEAVFDLFATVIMTSATLTVENRFDYLRQRLGLDLLEKDRVSELQLPAPFDYERQAMIAIPTDIPQPNDSRFADVLPALVLQAVRISKGRAFVLFTSFSLLNKTFRKLESELASLGYTPLRQGAESRHRLLERFRRDKSSVLFGTDSFWEGVDVPGDALELVVITRLPFRVPNEPVVEARVEAIERRGGNPFLEYSVPQAAIKFKQGFGRLIRNKTDHGAVLILDKRVIEKFYGRTFLRSLPPCRTVSGSAAEVFREMEKFFEGFRRRHEKI